MISQVLNKWGKISLYYCTVATFFLILLYISAPNKYIHNSCVFIIGWTFFFISRFLPWVQPCLTLTNKSTLIFVVIVYTSLLYLIISLLIFLSHSFRVVLWEHTAVVFFFFLIHLESFPFKMMNFIQLHLLVKHMSDLVFAILFCFLI